MTTNGVGVFTVEVEAELPPSYSKAGSMSSVLSEASSNGKIRASSNDKFSETFSFCFALSLVDNPIS